MAMQKLETTAKSEYEFITLEEKGDSVEGYYIGSETFDKDGDELTRHLFDVGGEKQSLLGGKVLNDRLGKIEKGTRTRVTFLGKVKGKNGRSYKNFDIEFDAEDIQKSA